MTGNFSSLSSSEQSQRERALLTLDHIREALNDDDLQKAIEQIDVLQTQLGDWKRRDARQWLDDALHGDLLLFNMDEANKRLEQWQTSLNGGDDRDLTLYRERVEERTKAKHADLQIRGVKAHCQELWQQAAQLEHGDLPPKPETVLNTCYLKARDVVRAAASENPNNVNLDVLLQQAERILRDKRKADTLYRSAIEDDRYADVLDALTELEAVALIPRYRVVTEEASDELTTFDRMLPYEEARSEIERMGRVWAGDRVQEMQQYADQQLQNYQPQAALDALQDRKLAERFVPDEVNQNLRNLERRANEDLRRLEQAERRARQAQRLAPENPLGAWDVYSEAYRTYAGAPTLTEVRKSIVEQMATQLRELIEECERAFTEKRMDRIRQIYQGARLDYSEKDETLDELLDHLAEFDRQASAYDDYLRKARGILDRLRDLAWENVGAAGELLNELEEYPPIVLEDLPDLHEVRALVRLRLNVEVIYNQTRQLLISNNVEEIEVGIQSAVEYEDEQRFTRLIDWLEIHKAYVEARKAYAIGDKTRALVLLDEVARFDGHPDQSNAQELAAQLRSTQDDE
jgi:hypothetical protein